MGGSSRIFLVGGLAALMVCAAFAMGFYVGRGSAPASTVSAITPPPSPQPRPTIAPVVVPAPAPSLSSPPLSDEPPARGPSPLVPPGSPVALPNGARVASGMLRADRIWTLLSAPEERSQPVADVPSGALLIVRGAFGEFALVEWSGSGGAVVLGWIAVPERILSQKATGTLAGQVRFSGPPPAPDPITIKRKDADFCKDKDIPYEPVAVKGGMLRDVVVRLTTALGVFDTPARPAVIEQVDCVYLPHVLGALAGQQLSIRNSDGTLHNVHAYKDKQSLFNQAQPKGSPALEKPLPDDGVLHLTCDVHPWMQAYVVVTDHPLFAVTGEDGAFRIPGVPAGPYEVEAWHPVLGSKKATVHAVADGEATLDFTFGAERKARARGDRIGF